MQTSIKYYISHLSDVLRFLLLHQFGGTYLDLDALIVNPLPDIPNFIGRESVDHEFYCNVMLLIDFVSKLL